MRKRVEDTRPVFRKVQWRFLRFWNKIVSHSNEISTIFLMLSQLEGKNTKLLVSNGRLQFVPNKKTRSEEAARNVHVQHVRR